MDTPKAFQSFYGREPTDQALRLQNSEVCVNSLVLYVRNLSIVRLVAWQWTKGQLKRFQSSSYESNLGPP